MLPEDHLIASGCLGLSSFTSHDLSPRFQTDLVQATNASARITKAYTLATEAERELWKQRLADLGVRSVNALIEMGDFDAARH
jgi:hypothetical protein